MGSINVESRRLLESWKFPYPGWVLHGWFPKSPFTEQIFCALLILFDGSHQILEKPYLEALTPNLTSHNHINYQSRDLFDTRPSDFHSSLRRQQHSSQTSLESCMPHLQPLSSASILQITSWFDGGDIIVRIELFISLGSQEKWTILRRKRASGKVK